ncbi:MAG: hypothetical protein C5B46_02335 [Proteobacteria bacterium]|nr:MAG: hypothetical protein C5B46_02335 [Pseudomonadota bacterium]
MIFRTQAKCKRCGRGMDLVAEIAPLGDKPGLMAFRCSGCGAGESNLIRRPSRPAQQQQQIQPDTKK